MVLIRKRWKQDKILKDTGCLHGSVNVSVGTGIKIHMELDKPLNALWKLLIPYV